MTLEQARLRMVQEQIQARGIQDSRVLEAMRTVPRELFVPESARHAAYEDRPLPVGNRQTISQPYTVAFMAAALNLTGTEAVLEVGTGSGYGAAVLSRLARVVHTIERIPELAAAAQRHLAAAQVENVHVFVGDGTLGLPERAPFDAICVTAAGKTLPRAYPEQLCRGGRILIPLEESNGRQTMWRFTKTGSRLVRESLGAFAFVPLIGADGDRGGGDRRA